MLSYDNESKIATSFNSYLLDDMKVFYFIKMLITGG